MANNQNERQRNNEVTFELKEHIEVLEERKDGWTKEVNIVAWNGGQAKIDIRDWDPSHERMTRGITLLEETAEKLAEALSKRYSDIPAAQRQQAVVQAAQAGGQA